MLKARLLVEGSEPDPRLGVVSAVIEEGINQISRSEIVVVCKQPDLNLDQWVGRKASLDLEETQPNGVMRNRYDGIIFECSREQHSWSGRDANAYRVVIRPAIWALSKTVRSRVYSRKSMVQVVKSILKSGGFREKLDYCFVLLNPNAFSDRLQFFQSYETDLDFMRHVLAISGVNFFFVSKPQNDEPEMLTFTDDRSFFQKPHPKPFTYRKFSGMIAGERIVHKLEATQRIGPECLDMHSHFVKIQQHDYKVEDKVPNGRLGRVEHTLQALPFERDNLQKRAHLASQELSTSIWQGKGESNIFVLRSGEVFKLDRNPLNRGENGFLITEVEHNIFHLPALALANKPEHMEYFNKFGVVAAETDYRPDCLLWFTMPRSI